LPCAYLNTQGSSPTETPLKRIDDRKFFDIIMRYSLKMPTLLQYFVVLGKSIFLHFRISLELSNRQHEDTFVDSANRFDRMIPLTSIFGRKRFIENFKISCAIDLVVFAEIAEKFDFQISTYLIVKAILWRISLETA
ncbi:hypothetical protein T07_4208, partial [Trichinella nelsoni]